MEVCVSTEIIVDSKEDTNKIIENNEGQPFLVAGRQYNLIRQYNDSIPKLVSPKQHNRRKINRSLPEINNINQDYHQNK